MQPSRIGAVASTVAFALLAVLAVLVSAQPAAPRGATPSELRTVVRAVDGDTVVLDGNEKLRLLGIDAPETERTRRKSGAECFGREASAHVRELVVGRRVRLEYERGALRDRYGRTLAWVHLEDGTFLNETLVREGFARVYRGIPRARRDVFYAAERAARREGRGLWGPACEGRR
jgi:micrococcal nuclease